MVGLAHVGRRSTLQSAIVQRVAFDAPWAWLAAGWRDLWAAPVITFSYGAAFAGLAAMMTIGLASRFFSSHD